MSGKKEDKLGADMENDRVFDIVSEIEERHKETEEGFSYKDRLKLKKLFFRTRNSAKLLRKILLPRLSAATIMKTTIVST